MFSTIFDINLKYLPLKGGEKMAKNGTHLTVLEHEFLESVLSGKNSPKINNPGLFKSRLHKKLASEECRKNMVEDFILTLEYLEEVNGIYSNKMPVFTLVQLKRINELFVRQVAHGEWPPEYTSQQEDLVKKTKRRVRGYHNAVSALIRKGAEGNIYTLNAICYVNETMHGKKKYVGKVAGKLREIDQLVKGRGQKWQMIEGRRKRNALVNFFLEMKENKRMPSMSYPKKMLSDAGLLEKKNGRYVNKDALLMYYAENFDLDRTAIAFKLL